MNGRLAAGTLASWLAVLAANAETSDPSPVIDFSVLTPAMDGRYVVASRVDWTKDLPPYLAWGQYGSGARNDRLRQLVAREGYNPERTIADRLIDRLAEASYRAVYEPIQRKPAGSVQSLSWDDLPAHPRGELMLDVTIHWICLCSDVVFSKVYPAISISWRVLDPAQVVVQPSRTLSYYHSAGRYKEEKWNEAQRKKKARRGAPESKQPPPPEYPIETVSEVCGFDSVKEAEENPAVLWGCLGEAYDAALRRLVIDLKRVHRPAGPAAGHEPADLR